jgi:hypothetical protein
MFSAGAVRSCCSALLAALLWSVAVTACAQEAVLEWFPIRPISFDAVLRQQTYGPDDREMTVQAGVTALRYGNLEVRGVFRHFSLHTQEFKTDQNTLFLNPRWNNFIDVLDFPAHRPFNRLIRHALFGPLEDRAVPYLGVLAGAVVPGPGASAPGHFLGGQLGVRFPLAFGVSFDVALEYSQFGVDFRGEAGQAQQWVMTTGIRF